jgi:hypothetical protein
MEIRLFNLEKGAGRFWHARIESDGGVTLSFGVLGLGAEMHLPASLIADPAELLDKGAARARGEGYREATAAEETALQAIAARNRAARDRAAGGLSA